MAIEDHWEDQFESCLAPQAGRIWAVGGKGFDGLKAYDDRRAIISKRFKSPPTIRRRLVRYVAQLLSSWSNLWVELHIQNILAQGFSEGANDKPHPNVSLDIRE